MKLERISAVAHTELPNAKPLSRSQSVSKTSAPVPERKRTPHKTATRPFCDPKAFEVWFAPETWDFGRLVNIARRSADAQENCPGNPGKERTSYNPSFRCVNHTRVLKCQHANKQ